MQNNIRLFTNLFIARDDMYAKQWRNKEGKWIFLPVKNSCNDKVVLQHLQGKITIGSYAPVGDMASWMVIDIDHQDKDLVQDIVNTCCKFELPCHIEYSGRKGFHLWFFFACPIKKSWLRTLGNFLAPGHEVFPKQNNTTLKNPGNLIKMPLGIHRATAKRCLFLDESFREHKDQWKYLKKASQDTIEEEHLVGILEIVRKSIEQSPPTPSQNFLMTYSGKSSCSLVCPEGYQRLLRHCVLRAIDTGASKGMRNSLAHCIVSEAMHRGLSQREAYSLILTFNANCSPPMPAEEPAAIVRRVYSQKTSYYYSCFHPVLAKFCQHTHKKFPA